MKRKSQWLVVVAALAALLVSSLMVQAQGEEEAVVWEYKVVVLPENTAQSATALNEAGEEGWELAAVYLTAAYLKRQQK